MNFTFRLLNSKDVPIVQKLLEDHYVAGHALAVYLGVTTDDFKNTYFARTETLMKQGISLGAFYKGKLCGIVIATKPDNKEYENYMGKIRGKEKIIARVFHALHGGNEAELIGTSNYLEVKRACIEADFRGKGVHHELGIRLMQHAKQKGVEKIAVYFVGDSVNLYNNRKIIRRIKLSDYVDPVTGKKEFGGMRSPYAYANLLEINLDIDDRSSKKSNL